MFCCFWKGVFYFYIKIVHCTNPTKINIEMLINFVTAINLFLGNNWVANYPAVDATLIKSN